MEAMKGQDILVMLKLLCPAEADWTYAGLAEQLGMSASEVHATVRRCEEAGLYNAHTRAPQREALREFLVHGLRYVFPVRPGPLVQGLPTSYAAPPLNRSFRFESAEGPVMPLPRGPVRGPEIRPLFRSAPQAAARDEHLHLLLALVDALRSGRARERRQAAQALTGLLASWTCRSAS